MFKLLKSLVAKTYKQKKSTLHWPANVDRWLEADFDKDTY